MRSIMRRSPRIGGTFGSIRHRMRAAAPRRSRTTCAAPSAALCSCTGSPRASSGNLLLVGLRQDMRHHLQKMAGAVLDIASVGLIARGRDRAEQPLTEITCEKPRMALSGVRSSWLICERKARLARSDASARHMADSSCSSASLREVMSSDTVMMPEILSPASRIGSFGREQHLAVAGHAANFLFHLVDGDARY